MVTQKSYMWPIFRDPKYGLYRCGGLDPFIENHVMLIGIMQQRFVCVLIALAFISTSSNAQTTWTVQEGSSIVIDGKSNKSDWSVTANEFTGSFIFEDDVPQSGDLVVAVREIKSGRSLIMDRLMHGAFQVDDYEEIAFSLGAAEEGEEGAWLLSGNLTMTGTTKPVTVQLSSADAAEGQKRFNGTYELKMSDYEMKAPTAMFGSLITKDDVMITFDLTLGE